VCGLTNIDKLPAWYIHFYNAITQLENGFYKSALLDYAVAFETFVESFLNECFKDKFGDEIAEYILKKCWRIEDRSKELLELVTGHRLTENKDLYELWHKKVRQLRNELVHGKNNKIKKEDAETAHQASYQAIAWINSLKLNTIDQDVLSFLHI